ncbi:4-nitrophenylphosphatase, partial [Trypanosoma cruzi]
QDRPSLRLRCVQSIPLRPKQHEPPLRDVVEGPSLFVTKENVVNASPVTVPAETDSSGEVEEEDGVVKDVEEEAFLLSLLRQTSVWNVALLERCGILTSSGGSPCPEWSNWSCVDMAVRAVRYLQQATCTRPQHERAIDIVGMIVEWASVMHAALVVHPRPESHVSQAGAGAVAEEVFSRVPPEITPAQKYPTKNEKSPAPHDDSLVTPGRMTPPRPLLPSSLASVQFPASATKNRSGSRGSGASVETEKTIREAVPLQTHGNTSTPLEMKRRLTTAVKEHDMPFMSVCSEVLEAAFQLQQSHVQSKRSHFRNSDAGERVDGEDGHSADAD